MTDWTLDPEAFIERCIMAIGGLDALRNAKTIHIVAQRTRYDGTGASIAIELHIYRAFGGRIRIEERVTNSDVDIFIVNGLAGCRLNQDKARPLSAPEIEKIKRNVRLYPRNFLAHANEHPFCAPERTQEDSQVYALYLPTESVRFCFDQETFLCRSSHDGPTGVKTLYEEYKTSSEGILTPYLERRFKDDKLFEEDRIEGLEFNAELEETLFHVS